MKYGIKSYEYEEKFVLKEFYNLYLNWKKIIQTTRFRIKMAQTTQTNAINANSIQTLSTFRQIFSEPTNNKSQQQIYNLTDRSRWFSSCINEWKRNHNKTNKINVWVLTAKKTYCFKFDQPKFNAHMDVFCES